MSQKTTILILCIILFGVLLRLQSVNLPLLDKNAWRQTDTAAIARNFYENEFNIFYPRVDWRGASPGYVESEFQIYTFLIAILYKLFGVHEWFGRLLSLLFFTFSTIFIYKLAKKIFDHKTAIFSCLIFIISPLSIHFSRAFMPTSMLVCCSVASVYYFSEWMDQDKRYFLLAAIISTTLAILIKLTSLYLGLPLLYLAIRKYGKPFFFQWRLWLFAALVLIPPYAWYYHAYQLFLKTHLTFGILGGGYSKFGNLGYWSDPGFYKTIVSRLGNDLLIFPGLLLAGIGFFLKVDKKNYTLFWWALAFGIYIMLVAEGHETHYYYQMPLVPILCIYAGKGLSYLWELDLFKDSFLSNIFSTKSALILLCILMAIASVVKARQYLSYNPERLAYGKRIDQLTEKNSLIVLGGWNKGKHLQIEYPPSDPIDFYVSHRKGWEINLDDWSLVLVDSFREQGAKYFASFWPMGMDTKKEFAQGMKEKYKLLEGTDRWIIYALE